MKYRFLEEIALADTAFEAFGKTEKELFENAALGVFEVMADTKKVKGKEKKKVKIKADTLEKLLHVWLEEIVYIKDVEGMVFNRSECKVTINDGKFECEGNLQGQKVLELNERILKTDVKAITWHKFKIKKEKGFTATVVLDV